jgi:hypothetical protein
MIATLSLISILSFSASALAVFPHLSDEGVRRFWIYAKNPNNPTVRVKDGEQYRFWADSDDKWNNGTTDRNANGYAGSGLDSPRYSEYPMISMVCEIHNSPNLGAFTFTGFKFLVGTGTTKTVSRDGYLFCFANDNLAFYGDNSGRIRLKITRKE